MGLLGVDPDAPAPHKQGRPDLAHVKNKTLNNPKPYTLNPKP